MAQQISDLDERLDKWEKKIGLRPLEPYENEDIINTYLNYTWDELQKTDAEGCAIMHFHVSSYIVSLQRVTNRLEARMNYTNDPDERKELKARLDRLKYLSFPLKNLLESLKILHSSKELEKKENLYEQRRRIYHERENE